MDVNTEGYGINHKPDKFGANMFDGVNLDSMGKEDRKRVVLSILVNSGLALPPAAIFRNARLGGATFGRRSVDNYLNELLDEGMVLKVDGEALEDGEFVEVPKGEKGYFIATEDAYSEFE